MLTVNREAVSQSLRAVFEHAGTEMRHLNFVGITNHAIWATDRYTIGISSIQLLDAEQGVYLPTKEARDLLRFVRPERVRDRSMRVGFLVAQDPSFDPSTGHPGLVASATNPDGLPAQELHVGIYPENPDGDVLESEVYSLHPDDYPMLDFDKLWSIIQDIRKHTFFSEEFVMQAGLVARFKAAERQQGDRMRLYPAAPRPDHRGQRALVTVGSDFLGAIAGLQEPGDGSDIPFGDSSLQDWGL